MAMREGGEKGNRHSVINKLHFKIAQQFVCLSSHCIRDVVINIYYIISREGVLGGRGSCARVRRAAS